MNAFGGLNNGCALRSELGFMRAGDWRPVYDLEGIPTLRGKHNADNALAAILATSQFLQARGGDGTLRRPYEEPLSRELWPNFGERRFMEAALRSFPGLPHRMEEVGRAGRILFINDSKATNADAAEKALASFPGGILWIFGGRAKEGGIESAPASLPPRRESLSDRRGDATISPRRSPQAHVPNFAAARSRSPWRAPRATPRLRA